MRSQTIISAELQRFTDDELITEVLNRGYDEHSFTGAVYALTEMAGHRHDEMFGYSEAGLHGKQSDKPKGVKREPVRPEQEYTDIG